VDNVSYRHAFTTRAGGLAFAWEGGAWIYGYAGGSSRPVVKFSAAGVRLSRRAFEREVRAWLVRTLR
jgi:hypothetical protein